MRKLNDIDLVITDWSGVISDDRLPVYEANMRVFEKHGVHRIFFDEWLPETQVSPREYFASKGLIQSDDGLFEEYRIEFLNARKNGIHPVVYKDAKKVLQLISKNKKIIVVSSHPADHLQKEASEYGLSEYISQFIGNTKDKATEIERVVQNEKVLKTHSIYLGDTIYDIQAAKRAGVRSVGVATGYHMRNRLEAENPDIVVDSLTELCYSL